MRVLALVVVLLAGCAGTLDKSSITRVDSDLTVLDYNDITNRYADQPTFVDVGKRNGAGKMLIVEADLYGPGATFYFPEEDALATVQIINKYFDWRKTAMERGDTLKKGLGKASSWSQFDNRFRFFSANPSRHLLEVKLCPLGCSSSNNPVIYFDEQGARELKALLLALQQGDLNTRDSDAIYQ